MSLIDLVTNGKYDEFKKIVQNKINEIQKGKNAIIESNKNLKVQDRVKFNSVSIDFNISQILENMQNINIINAKYIIECYNKLKIEKKKGYYYRREKL